MSVARAVKMVGLGAMVFTLTVEWLGWCLRWLRHWRGSQGPLKEVIFFPSEMACVEHLFTPSMFPCTCPLAHGVETSLSRLLRHILSATTTLDLCVFAFSNQELSRAVLTLHSRGLAIRVLTDKDYTLITGSQIGVLRRAGICVRCDSGSVHMHHKFAVVNGLRLITGSLNWTLTAIQSNKENILVTEEPDLVRPYLREFERLWDTNDPAHRHPASISEKPSSLFV
ncbi:mitochondrial cardiolipin hydrolase [Osmerus eperlanus]|uniref:mitochondrial cardiolipin hydrolase n=1 Tax=Osmerus eperlanus TaxID=29151 RepID=UPI002E1614D7